MQTGTADAMTVTVTGADLETTAGTVPTAAAVTTTAILTRSPRGATTAAKQTEAVRVETGRETMVVVMTLTVIVSEMLMVVAVGQPRRTTTAEGGAPTATEAETVAGRT